ncbi:MAG TPA: glycosyltransferase [Lacunisphaera sp.]|nr:glycosyltransferase [Lacunisphaera sp.]
MRIVHAVYIPRLSGAEVLVSLLAPRHQEAGHTTMVLSLRPSQPSFDGILSGLRKCGVVVKTPKHDLTRWQRIGFLWAELLDFEPDVVFAHSVIPSAYLRTIAAFTRIRIVTVLHDASQDDYRDWRFRLAEYLLPAPRAVVAVAARGLQHYRERFRGVSGEVIANAIDLNALKSALEKRTTYRARVLCLEDGETLFVSVGRFSRQKNQDVLISAFERLPDSVLKKCRLLIIGISEDAGYEAYLRMKAKILGERVSVVANRADSMELLACADVFCMPSLQEGFSLAFLEGLALEVRVLASEIDSFAFAARWPGVTLIPATAIDLWAKHFKGALFEGGRRYARPVEKYDPAGVARTYERVAMEVASQ